MNSLATSCYQFMLNIKRTARIINERILDTCNKINLGDLLIERQLHPLGHWLTKEDSSIKMYTLCTIKRGKNCRGRPRDANVKLTQQATGLLINERK